jgi:hypothetical protein
MNINPFQSNFLPTAYPSALIFFGGKEVGGLLVIILQFKKRKKMEKQKEYNLRYLLAKVRTT